MNAPRAVAAVREPTADELAGFNDLNDILTWAAIKGDPGLYFTQAGALLYAMAADEFCDISAEEFATVDPGDFEEALNNWRFSHLDDGHGAGNPDDYSSPTAFLNVCSISSTLVELIQPQNFATT